ncbi:MAG: DNA primase [Desulfomonile tiedjei]|nr:DNA primase [Desulfomonile tiedjei]
MRIPESKIAEVAAAADIVEVISRYVNLKRAGKDFRGLCPFHGDKDPSFYVSPQKGIFHCFGCAVGGSVFNFLMKVENIPFTEAVTTLARQHGVSMPREYTPGRKDPDEKDRLTKALEAASRYYRDHLESNAAVKDYLARRGIPPHWFEQIGFGFAPDAWDGIQTYLLRAGVDVRDAVAAGLVRPRQGGGGYYDYFRSRLMIPIRDLGGRLVAYGGRIVGEGEPKYLNSPESSLYRKRQVLYGLDAAKDAIRKEGFVILVEGYFDQISLRVRGVENVVAPLGTALGPEQIRILRRFSSDVITIFDADEAGLRAARRSIPLFISEGIEPRCLILNEDKDPDEAINRIGVDAFRGMLAEAGSTIDFLLDGLQARFDLGTMQGRNLAMEECLPVLREIADSKERDYAIERFASRLRLREDRLRRAIASSPTARARIEAGESERRRTLFDFPGDERNVVRGMLLRDGVIDRVVESGVMKDLEDPVLRSAAERMVAYREEYGIFDSASFSLSLEDSQLASVVAGWLQPCSEEDDLRPEVDGDRMIFDSIDRIRQRKILRRKAEIQERMKVAPAGTEEYNVAAAELQEIAKRLYK